MAQQITYREKMRLLIGNHTAVGRYGYLTVCKSIKGVYSLVRRGARQKMNQYVGMFRRIVINLTYFDFPLFKCLQYRIDYHTGSLAIRDFRHSKRLIVNLLDFGTHFHCPTSLTIIITADIDIAAGGEIGIERKLLAAQISHTGIEYFIEIVGQNLRRQPNRNTFHPLEKQQWKLHRQRHRLFVAPVIRRNPVGYLPVIERVKGKCRQPGLDITAGGGIVTGQDISPVTLGIHQQFFLA